MDYFWLVLTLKAIAVLALAAFLPFTARSYYHFRHRQRQGEIARIFEKLEMIEGVDAHDNIRFTELGVDNCYDLAATDFIPLLIKTPYNARELIDWILQAKLCVKFGRGVKDLRDHGFRTIVDLEGLDNSTIEELSKETRLRVSSLTRATKAVKTDHNIKRLQRAAQLLSEYWEGDTEKEKRPKKPRIGMA